MNLHQCRTSPDGNYGRQAMSSFLEAEPRMQCVPRREPGEETGKCRPERFFVFCVFRGSLVRQLRRTPVRFRGRPPQGRR